MIHQTEDGQRIMTVQDLIAIASKYPADTPVAMIPGWALTGAFPLPAGNAVLHQDPADIADICDDSYFDTTNGYPQTVLALHAYL